MLCQMDPDVDITSPDSDNGLEEDELATQADRDSQWCSWDHQAEKGIPGWPGFGEEVWIMMHDGWSSKAGKFN